MSFDHRESARVWLTAGTEINDQAVKITHLLTAIAHLLMSIDDRLASTPVVHPCTEEHDS